MNKEFWQIITVFCWQLFFFFFFEIFPCSVKYIPPYVKATVIKETYCFCLFLSLYLKPRAKLVALFILIQEACFPIFNQRTVGLSRHFMFYSTVYVWGWKYHHATADEGKEAVT